MDLEDDTLDAVTLRLDAAAEGALNEAAIYEKVALQPGEENSSVAWAAAAFLYYEHHGERTGRGRFFDQPFPGHPPAYEDLPEGAFDLWNGCAVRSTAPLVRARLHDLLFEAKQGNGRDHAGAAAEAYLERSETAPASPVEESTGESGPTMGSLHALERALDLATRVGLSELAQRIIDTLLENARSALDNPSSRFGNIYRSLDPLAHHREEVPDVAELLERARDRFQNDVYSSGAFIELQMANARGNNERKNQLLRESIEALLEAASKSPPLNAMQHLEDAAVRAEQLGLSDLKDEAVRRLQDFANVDIGLTHHVTKVTHAREDVDNFVNHILSLDSWQAAITLLVSIAPPTGSTSQNKIQVTMMATNTPLLARIPTRSLGPDNLTRKTVSADEMEAYNLVRIERMRLQADGPLRSIILKKIGEKWGNPSEEELVEFFSASHIASAELAAALGRSLVRFYESDFEGAAFTVVPRIERLVRELLLKARIPVYQTELGQRPGGYPGLGSMLAKLTDTELDESWLRFIGTLLSRQEGLNYRNELLHGSVDNVDYRYSGYVLMIAIWLAITITVPDAE